MCCTNRNVFRLNQNCKNLNDIVFMVYTRLAVIILHFTHLGGPGKRTLSEMKDAMDLFTHLRQTRRLTKDNLIVLQSMLFHLHRRDLQKKVLEYARRLGNVLHFYNPSDQPGNCISYLFFSFVLNW